MLESLFSFLILWFLLSLMFPRWISNPIPMGIGFIKRIFQRLMRATGRQVWWHFYGKQQERRGHGFALQHLILIWNIFATCIILYALTHPHQSSLGITPEQAIPGLIIFWVFWVLYNRGQKNWRKLRSPKRKLPGRHR